MDWKANINKMDFPLHAIDLRGLFHKSGSGGSDASANSTTTNHTCALSNPLLETTTDPVAGHFTFHHLGTIIAGCAAAFSILSILILMFRHATHLSKPNEQLKILRICLLIPINSAIQFVGQIVPAAYFYIIPWGDMMQSFALGNFFLLMLEFISPHENQRDFFFSALKVPSKKSGKAPKDGIKWYRRKWIMVFQYPIVQFVVSVATDVTNSPNLNIYCGNTNKPYFAHLWLNLFHVLSTITAVVSCLRFYKTLKSELAGHKPLSKLFAFKLLVGLNLLMNVVFWILNSISNSPLDPTNTMSEADVVTGIPAIVNCLIMVPFSIFFHYAYDVRPYILDRHPESGSGHSHYQGGFLGIRAFAGMFDPGELLGAIGFVFKMGKQGAPGKSATGLTSGSSGPGFGTVTSNESRDAGPAYEMSGRDQRRLEKHGRVDNTHRYGHRNGGNEPAYSGFGWTDQQSRGQRLGQHQQRHQGYR